MYEYIKQDFYKLTLNMKMYNELTFLYSDLNDDIEFKDNDLLISLFNSLYEDAILNEEINTVYLNESLYESLNNLEYKEYDLKSILKDADKIEREIRREATYYIRLDISQQLYDELFDLVMSSRSSSERLEEAIMNYKYIKISDKKIAGAKQTNALKIERTKKKIAEAVHEMKTSKEYISIYSVAKKTGITYPTVKKYKDLLGLE